MGLVESEWIDTLSTIDPADIIYEDFVIRYQDINIEQREKLTGINKNYHLRVVLFTQARKQYPEREP